MYAHYYLRRWLIVGNLASNALALDWWVHSSCESRLGAGVADGMLFEAVDTAKAVVKRLDDGDENMLNVFKTVMKFDYQNPAGHESDKILFNRNDLHDSPNHAGD